MSFIPVQQRRLSSAIFRQVVEQLARGELKPGDRLPSEPDLAIQLGVSRAGVREALRMLEQAGLVTIKRGAHGGATIRSNRHDGLSEGFALALQLDGVSREELAEARRVLEASTARLASLRATENDYQQMRDALKVLDDNPASHNALIQSNAAFHTAVTGAAHNRVLLIMLASVQGIIDRSLAQARFEPPIIARVASDHRRIFEAILARDPDEAESAMLGHIELTEHELKDYYLAEDITYWPLELENS